jgi:hypothetical protein
MRGLGLAVVLLGLAGAVSASTGACNQQGDCPAATAIKSGASCSDDQLQCPYSLSAGEAPCTSCTCTAGAWACPSDFTCGDGGTPPTSDGGPPDMSEAAADDTGTGDAPSEAAPTDGGAADAPADAGGAG